MRIAQRLSAIVLMLTFVVGNVALCAGWVSTPEARMACCAEEATCPMHHGPDTAGATGKRTMTQADADTCCATSQDEAPSQSTPTSAWTVSLPVAGPAVALPPEPAALAHSGSRRTVILSATTVPKHLLLSVFLV